mgnify:FL=1
MSLNRTGSPQDQGHYQQIPSANDHVISSENRIQNNESIYHQPSTSYSSGVSLSRIELKVKFKSLYFLFWILAVWAPFGLAYWIIDTLKDIHVANTAEKVLDFMQIFSIFIAGVTAVAMIVCFQKNIHKHFGVCQKIFILLALFEFIYMVTFMIDAVRFGFLSAIPQMSFLVPPLVAYLAVICYCNSTDILLLTVNADPAHSSFA